MRQIIQLALAASAFGVYAIADAADDPLLMYCTELSQTVRSSYRDIYISDCVIANKAVQKYREAEIGRQQQQSASNDQLAQFKKHVRQFDELRSSGLMQQADRDFGKMFERVLQDKDHQYILGHYPAKSVVVLFASNESPLLLQMSGELFGNKLQLALVDGLNVIGQSGTYSIQTKGKWSLVTFAVSDPAQFKGVSERIEKAKSIDIFVTSEGKALKLSLDVPM